MIEVLIPKNKLEQCLKNAQDENKPSDNFVNLLMTSTLFVASISDLSG